VAKETADCHRTSAVDKWNKSVCPCALNFESVGLRHKTQKRCSACNKKRIINAAIENFRIYVSFIRTSSPNKNKFSAQPPNTNFAVDITCHYADTYRPSQGLNCLIYKVIFHFLRFLKLFKGWSTQRIFGSVRLRRLGDDMLMVQTKGWQLSGRLVTSKYTANVTARCNQGLFQNNVPFYHIKVQRRLQWTSYVKVIKTFCER